MATVYIVQDDGTKNFTEAAKFGDLRTIVTRNYPMYGAAHDHSAHLSNQLTDFNAEEDYLLLVGDPINIAMAVHHVLEVWGKATCLKWDRENREYTPVHL